MGDSASSCRRGDESTRGFRPVLGLAAIEGEAIDVESLTFHRLSSAFEDFCNYLSQCDMGFIIPTEKVGNFRNPDQILSFQNILSNFWNGSHPITLQRGSKKS